MTRSQKIAQELSAGLRARNPVWWIITREEGRVEANVIEAAAAAGYQAYTWDVAQGILALGAEPGEYPQDTDPGTALNTIRAQAKTINAPERRAWIMRDLPAWLEKPLGITTLRQLRNLARMLPGCDREHAQAIIILTPSSNVPEELQGHVTVIDWPLPDRDEIAAVLDAALRRLPDDIKANAAPNGTREQAIDAALGLSADEAAACYAKSLVQLKKIDPQIVAGEKKRVIAKEKMLEWIDPLPFGLDAVGGLDQLKKWMITRKLAFSPKARAAGLPMPKGVLVGGIQGCGKSLTCKAIPTYFGLPLIRYDFGAAKGPYVGQSEAAIRRGNAVIDAVGPCVVWIDEIDKIFAGAANGAADGGVAMDQLGSFLTWMQERSGGAFVIATANKVSVLPPELIRRFDVFWWVDLPNQVERTEIILAALRANGRGEVIKELGPDIGDIAQKCNGFTGDEIAKLIPEAMFRAFADGEREITTYDLLDLAKDVVPLSKTMASELAALREWATGRARPATSPEQAKLRSEERQIDL